jgi:hypothetical protein
MMRRGRIAMKQEWKGQLMKLKVQDSLMLGSLESEQEEGSNRKVSLSVDES